MVTRAERSRNCKPHACLTLSPWLTPSPSSPYRAGDPGGDGNRSGIPTRMLVHLITDFSKKGGAQTMLARLVSVTQEPVAIISLGGVSDHYRTMSANREALYLAEDSLSMTALPSAIARISRFIRRERPRAVVCWMYHAMLAGTLAAAVAGLRTPVVWTVRQSLDDPASLSRSTRAALNITKRLSRWTTGIIYNSSRAKQLHEAYGYASHNSAVIANGFDIPEPATYEPLFPPVLGAAGRLHPQKDFGPSSAPRR